jgi:arsenate reductase
MTVTIFHNPSCGTSRNTLAMIRASGIEPAIIEYLNTPPTRARLCVLIEAVGLGVRGLMREKGTPFHELGLADPALSDSALIDAMLAHPVLINRPIVETSKGTRLCRPSELVFDLLDDPVGAFTKEDGEVVTPATASGKPKVRLLAPGRERVVEGPLARRALLDGDDGAALVGIDQRDVEP